MQGKGEREDMHYKAFDVPDEWLCGAAFLDDEAPDLLVLASWAVNGYRYPVADSQWMEPESLEVADD